jgi:hypothetical protein
MPLGCLLDGLWIQYDVHAIWMDGEPSSMLMSIGWMVNQVTSRCLCMYVMDILDHIL